jgi:glycosyltransferase involved in cell wall biosynthesis
MRIAHVTATFPPYYSGTGMVCYHNALELARRGHDVTVLTAAHPPGTYEYPPEIRVRRLPVAFRIGNAPLLPGLLQLQKYDIIHLHYPFFFGAELVWLAAHLRQLSYVITYHQDVLFTGLMRLAEHNHHVLLGRIIMAQASKLYATSWDYARASRVSEMLQARPQIVDEIPNGVDTKRFCPDGSSRLLRDRYACTDQDKIVLFVGAIDHAHYFKGIDGLLQAIRHIDDASVKLLLVGDGDLRETYQQQAQELGIAQRVLFCGRVSAEELPQHYVLGDILVLPSTTMGEAFGMVLIEAMACGKPVIASNLPGVRSVVHDGEDGLLVEPGNVADLAAKIRQLLDDPQRRQEMGKRGRAKVERKYAWDAIGAKLEQTYYEVLNGAA